MKALKPEDIVLTRLGQTTEFPPKVWIGSPWPMHTAMSAGLFLEAWIDGQIELLGRRRVAIKVENGEAVYLAGGLNDQRDLLLWLMKSEFREPDYPNN